MNYCYRLGYTRTVNEPPIWLRDNIIAYHTNTTSCVMTIWTHDTILDTSMTNQLLSCLEIKLLTEFHILSSHDGIFDKKLFILSFHGAFESSRQCDFEIVIISKIVFRQF